MYVETDAIRYCICGIYFVRSRYARRAASARPIASMSVATGLNRHIERINERERESERERERGRGREGGRERERHLVAAPPEPSIRTFQCSLAWRDKVRGSHTRTHTHAHTDRKRERERERERALPALFPTSRSALAPARVGQPWHPSPSRPPHPPTP